MGSEMEISEDTNAVREIYDHRLKLIAGFRLGGSALRPSVRSSYLWRLRICERIYGEEKQPLHQSGEQIEGARLHMLIRRLKPGGAILRNFH